MTKTVSPLDFESPEVYKGILRSPFHWYAFAIAFKAAADKIAEHTVFLELRPPDSKPVTIQDQYWTFAYMFLNGLALENVLKGLIVAADANCVAIGEKEGELKIRGIGHHNLDQLARRLEKEFKQYKLTFNDEEYKLLERLSGYVKEKGKYPVTKKFEPMFAGRLLKGKDPEIVGALWKRLSEVLGVIVLIVERQEAERNALKAKRDRSE
jgi:hypothetical protein